MKVQECLGQDTNPALCLQCVHRGQCGGRFLPHVAIQGSRLKGSTTLWLHHLEHLEHSPLCHHSERKERKNIAHRLCASV